MGIADNVLFLKTKSTVFKNISGKQKHLGGRGEDIFGAFPLNGRPRKKVGVIDFNFDFKKIFRQNFFPENNVPNT